MATVSPLALSAVRPRCCASHLYHHAAKSCATSCEGSAYFGTQFGEECYCSSGSDELDSLGEATCNMECSGDDSETCGGRLAISVYEYTGYAGCFVDNVRDRVLTAGSFVDDEMTAEVREAGATIPRMI